MMALNKLTTRLFGVSKMCMFIGCNHSMGLTNGKTYKINIMPWNSSGVQVTWYDSARGSMWCPYSSVDTFLQNWEVCK